MGSEGPAGVTIHVTGFKKFHGVAENPTEAIVNDLKAFVEERGLPAGVTLGSCTVLDAAGDGARTELYKVLDSGISNMTETNKVVWVSSFYYLFCFGNLLLNKFLHIYSIYKRVFK